MPLSLPAMGAAVICDGKELETYGVKQDGTSSLEAFIASEAGKVRTLFPTRTNSLIKNRQMAAIQNHVLEQFEQL
jgi:hypothetical protein